MSPVDNMDNTFSDLFSDETPEETRTSFSNLSVRRMAVLGIMR
jgi:hypothetical protein